MYPGVLYIIINICSFNNSTCLIFSFYIRQAKSGIGHPAYDSVIRAMAFCHRHNRLFNFLPQIIHILVFPPGESQTVPCFEQDLHGSGGWRSGVLSLKNKASATGKVIFFTLIFIYSMIIFTISIHLPTPLFLS